MCLGVSCGVFLSWLFDSIDDVPHPRPNPSRHMASHLRSRKLRTILSKADLPQVLLGFVALDQTSLSDLTDLSGTIGTLG